MRPGRLCWILAVVWIATLFGWPSRDGAAEPRVLHLANARPLPIGDAVDSGLRRTSPAQNEAGAAAPATPAPSPTNWPPLDDTDPVGPRRETRTLVEKYDHGGARISRQVLAASTALLVNHGLWQWFDSRGQLLARGKYHEGRRHGRWQRLITPTDAPLLTQMPYRNFTPPFLSQAHFRDGELHGTWQIIDSAGRTASEIEFADGQRHGVATWWHSTGAKMLEMNYLQGALDGRHTTWNSAGAETARKVFQLGRELRVLTREFPTGGRQAEETVALPKLVVTSPDQWWNARLAAYRTEGSPAKHGTAAQWHPNGQMLTRGEFDLDEPMGWHTWWHENGQKASEGEFRMGRRELTWTWWHPNGQMSMRGEYSGGIPVGIWTSWSPDGKVLRQEEADRFGRPENATDSIVVPNLRGAMNRSSSSGERLVAPRLFPG